MAETGLMPVRRAAFEREILNFLRYCKVQRTGVTLGVAQFYLQQGHTSGDGAAREALRWFVRASRRRLDLGLAGALSATVDAATLSVEGVEASRGGRNGEQNESVGCSPGRSREPRSAAEDLGGADWERALIASIRERGLLWRTEEAYRAWAVRFAQFLTPRSPYAAEARDVASFLSMLAVTRRASRSTQRQALNALVFFMQEALKRQVGELEFRRAEPGRKMPTVLTPDECVRLFAQLEATTRLMAELAYGAGLRLLELLRLRIHHLDLARQQLQIYDGKGAKHRLTVLPAALVPRLTAHLERLRVLHAADRLEKLEGVWLPEGLARKYPRAGERWEWQWLFVPSPPRGHPT